MPTPPLAMIRFPPEVSSVTPSIASRFALIVPATTKSPLISTSLVNCAFPPEIWKGTIGVVAVEVGSTTLNLSAMIANSLKGVAPAVVESRPKPEMRLFASILTV